MAVRNPPLWIAAGCYTDADMRILTGALAGETTGAGVIALGNPLEPNALLVSAPGGMAVSVAAGKAWVQGTDAAGQGAYLVDNPTATSVTITAAHATLPRIDKIVAKVNDPAFTGSGTPTWSLIAVAGTPNASPVAPATPASSLLLATVAVAAATGAIVAGNITDARVVWSPPYARGTLDSAIQTATQGIVGVTPVDVTGLDVQWTAWSTRRYELRAVVPYATKDASTGLVTIHLRQGAGGPIIRTAGKTMQGGDVDQLEIVHVIDASTGALSGAQDWRVALGSSSGTINTGSTAARTPYFTVDDRGPI